MIGIYFSGTGNTKYCLEKFVALYDRNIDITPLEDTGTMEKLHIIKTSFLLIQSITVTYLKLYGILSAKILMYGKENVFSLLQQWDCLAAMVQAYLQDCSRDTAHRYGVDFI